MLIRFALIGLGLVWYWLTQPPTPVTQPNIVIVLGDDIAKIDVENYSTPSIDAMAAVGLWFDRAYSSPLCSQTRHEIMFGEYRTQNAGSVTFPGPDTPNPDQYTTWDMLKSEGYATCMVGKWHLGYHRYDEYGLDAWRSGRLSNEGDHYTWQRWDDETETTSTVHDLIADRDAAIEWWNGTSCPKALIVNVAAAHGPQQRPPDSLLPPGYPATPTGQERYEAQVIAWDTMLGQLYTAIDDGNTYWFVAGDNGTPGLVGGQNAKGTAYERGTNVPLLVAGPGISQGVRSQVVGLVDLMGTLGQLVGAAPPPGYTALDTVSFYPALGSEMWVGRAAIYVDAEKNFRSRAAVSDRWKVLRHKNLPDVLYDLDADPTEQNALPLSEGPSAWVNGLVVLLDEHE